MKQKNAWPRIGMRIIKSSLAVWLCYLVNIIRGSGGIVFYSQLSVLWCIQPYVGGSLQKAWQRIVGTLVGAGYGLMILLLEVNVFREHPKWLLAEETVIAGAIILVLYTTVVLRKTDASYFACVVFLSIVVNHLSDGNPFLFVWNRVLDTLIGIILALIINSFRLPHRKRKDILFVSGLDETLLNNKNRLSAYSKVELNHMISEGVNFTVATMRTPAAIIEAMRDVNLNLPVIAMDGAVLYDIKEKRYLKTYVMPNDTTQHYIRKIKAAGLDYFVNSIIDDMLVIYYEELRQEAAKDIMKTMRRSPYRNYLNRPMPEDERCVYIMIIDRTERVESFYRLLEKEERFEKSKVLFYPSIDYPGYSYIKIYNHNATKTNMIHYLEQELSVNETITFGSIEGKYDYVVSPDEPDRVIRIVHRLFEPLGFPSKEKCDKISQ